MKMQNHIGCICLPFPHSAFSNVSSNCLPERMQSRTGRICLPFLPCVFSNVSSNCLPVRMQSHTGCTYLSFPHCAFSNVSPKCLAEGMHIYSGCIYLDFLHCNSQDFVDPSQLRNKWEKGWSINLSSSVVPWVLVLFNSSLMSFSDEKKKVKMNYSKCPVSTIF